MKDNLSQQAIALLESLIASPSFSKEEHLTSDLIANFLESHGVAIHRELLMYGRLISTMIRVSLRSY